MRRLLGVAGLLVAGLTASCGSVSGSGSGSGSGSRGDHVLSSNVNWSLAQGKPLDIQGIAWTKGHTLGDARGKVLELNGTPSAFVVAGDGIFYATHQDGNINYANAEGHGVLGAAGDADSMRASPDRRWLALIDYGTPYAARPAQAVVVDTRTGKEVLRTDKNMGEPNTDDPTDLMDLYGELRPAVQLVTDDVVWFEGPHGFLEYEIASDKLIDRGSHPFKEKGDQILSPWWAGRTADGQGIWNTSREWYVDQYGSPGTFTNKDGTTVRARPAGDYDLLGWIDDTTAYGRRGQQLVTCQVAGFTCTDVPGARGDSGSSGNLEPGDVNVRLQNGRYWDVLNP